ncbi:MAG: hypothetical protein JW765_10600 [Deltaproteobacteria bacterium]|nr:hypothetical protein [Candidatus Zymogenaceae bacterium]
MKKVIFRTVVTAALAVILGCATMPATDEGKAAPDDLAAAVVDKLAGAYENRDVSGFMTLVSARYFEGYGDLQTALEEALDTVVSADLDIRPERIWQREDGMVLMDAGWSKTIMRSTAPETETTSGRVTFIFIRYRTDVLKLFSQKGDPVFP